MCLNKPAKNLQSRVNQEYFDDIGPFSRRISVERTEDENSLATRGGKLAALRRHARDGSL
jgi:hypothetical protein